MQIGRLAEGRANGPMWGMTDGFTSGRGLLLVAPRTGAVKARAAGLSPADPYQDFAIAPAGDERNAAALFRSTGETGASHGPGGPQSTLIYSPATAVGTSGSDFMISIFAVSNLSGGGGNDLLIGDYAAFEAIRSNESNNTRATAKNLETNGQMWTTSGTDTYVGPASQPYGTIYIEGQAGATRWVSFSAAAGASISFDVDFAYGSGFGSDSDLVVDLVDASGNVLLTVDDVADLDQGSWSTNDPRFVGYVAGYTGTYYLQFREFDGNFEGDEAFLAYIAVSGHAAPGTVPIGADILNGDDGNDEIYGGEGDDSVNGGTGNDWLYGGYGNDTINGGDGNDNIQGHFGTDTIDGGLGDDTVGAGADNDFVYGGDGDDYVEGQGGLDTLDGQAGNDRLYGGDDNDTAIGGTGYDRMFGGNGDDLLQGGNDWDLLAGEAGSDTMQGGSGRDVMFGQIQGNVQGSYNSGSDSFDGGSENDLIFAGREADIVAGGTGDDLIVGDTNYVGYIARTTSLGTNLVFSLDDATNWSIEYSRIITSSETVAHTTRYVETYAGETRRFMINLVAGQTITIDIDSSFQATSAFSVDTIIGIYRDSSGFLATNDDNASLDAGSVSTSESFLTYVVPTTGTYYFAVWEYGGDNNFEGDEAFLLHVSVTGHSVSSIISGGADNLSGNDGNDDISGGFGDDTIAGGAGNDFISGGSGNDLIDGGEGNDNVLGDAGADTITDVSGTNTLSGGSGDDTITGGINNDTIDGGFDNDILSGGDGNDTITGGFGVDTINGGNGSDTISDIGGAGTVHGNAGGDTLTSNGVGSWYGDEDNDTIIAGGTGTQLLDGGTGTDRLDLTGLGGVAATVDLGAGTASFASGGVAGFENVNGGGGNETITGNGEANQFLGAGGADALNGAGGNDRLEGGDGNDTADGGAGDDVIFGGNNDDTLSGGADNDIVHGDAGFDIVSGGDGNDYISDRAGGGMLNGGAGDDTLVLGDAPYSQDDGIQTATGGTGADLFQLFTASNGAERDRVIDFNAAEGDRITLWGVNTGKVYGGYWPVEAYVVFAGTWSPVSFSFGAAFPAGTTTGIVQVFTYQTGGNTFLVADSNADLLFDAQDMVVQFDGLLTLTAASFSEGTFATLGTSGGDTITGTPGVDFIDGLAGNDTINALEGADYVIGGDGIDTVDGGAGDDQINGGIGNDALSGGADNDYLFGDTGDDTLNGGSGNDSLIGWTGADTMSGGIGDDTFWVDNAGDAVVEFAGEGNDRIYASIAYSLAAGADVEWLSTDNEFSSLALNLQGNGNANRIDGNNGANILRGEGGNDTLYGFGGTDYLVGGAGTDIMIGGAGDDTYYVDDTSDAIGEQAGEGNDRVAARITLALAADASIERIDVEDLTSTNAIDLTGSAIGNVIYGNDGQNILRGEAGNDELRGFGGNDFLVGGPGTDLMVGGLGDDTFYVDDASDAIGEIAGQGNDRIAASVSFVLSNGADVELLEAVNVADTSAFDLTGSDSANTITGNAGTNILRGEGGNDVLSGASGDDFLVGGSGNDVMNGGTGNDTYYVDSASDVVNEFAGEGAGDRVVASVTYALSANADVELLETATQSGTGVLDLTGSSFANVINGNDGANVLDGKGGSDTLTGFGGADTYQFTTALGAGNVDTIVGFVTGSDKIALDDAVFSGIGPVGALAAGAFATRSAAADADDRIIYNSATGALLFDADGNGAGAAVQFATIGTGLGLGAGDFMVI